MIVDNQTMQLRPVLADGFRLCWDAEEGHHVLLFPEGMVVLNDDDRKMLEYCRGTRTIAEIIEAISLTNPLPLPHHEIQHQLEYAIKNGWLVLR